MAITAVAAFAGAAAVTTGAVTATTLAMISVGVTAVGLVTKSKTLMKIGGGLGVGGMAASFVGLGSSAVGQAGQAAIDGANIADVAATAAGAPEAGVLSGVEAAQQASTVAPSATSAAPEAVAASNAGDLANSFADPTPVPAAARPAAAPVESSAAPAAARSAAPAAEAGRVDYGLIESAARPSTGSGIRAPVDPSAVRPTVNAMPTLERGSTFFDRIGQFWKGLDSSGKLAVGQTVSGLISGAGQGAAAYMAAEDRRKFEQEQIDQRRRDRGFVPTMFSTSRA